MSSPDSAGSWAPSPSESEESDDEAYETEEVVAVRVAFSLKDIFVGKTLHYTNRTLTTGAEEEAYFRARVSEFRTHRESANRVFSFVII